MSEILPLTGTFLDEITHDIPSQNWGRREWEREFELYSKIGIDTAIIIRAGYQDKCIFPSQVVPDRLPVYEDLAEVFLDLGEQYGVAIFFGLYDSGFHWLRRSWWKEVELNLAFIDEVVERYGQRSAFQGWYMCHETSRHDVHITQIFNALGQHCRKSLPKPILISPFPQGAKQFSGSEVMTLPESLDHWDRIFNETHGSFDICAFQDGQIHYSQLPDFLAGIQDLGERHAVRIWSNVESFDRDMPIKFPPADWRYLRYKLEAAKSVSEKAITFEFPHFMSPYSCYPAAHHLFDRYCEMAHIKPPSLR
ncbi:MAG TPA: DUF4434 domain-containing protein [Fimbriimonadaceae bacterium]|nr:DUF4434 domain-containing protein [Fimbriimonadaceae bacterium]HRJ32970.1 DUF4434 domain-containing protein [Fimbriimonadaceae bacterium]